MIVRLQGLVKPERHITHVVLVWALDVFLACFLDFFKYWRCLPLLKLVNFIARIRHKRANNVCVDRILVTQG